MLISESFCWFPSLNNFSQYLFILHFFQAVSDATQLLVSFSSLVYEEVISWSRLNLRSHVCHCQCQYLCTHWVQCTAWHQCFPSLCHVWKTGHLPDSELAFRPLAFYIERYNSVQTYKNIKSSETVKGHVRNLRWLNYTLLKGGTSFLYIKFANLKLYEKIKRVWCQIPVRILWKGHLCILMVAM